MKVTELTKACKRFDYLCSEEKVLCKLLQEKEAKPPSDVYLAAKDRQVIRFNYLSILLPWTKR
jgi:hypothetical protein